MLELSSWEKNFFVWPSNLYKQNNDRECYSVRDVSILLVTLYLSILYKNIELRQKFLKAEISITTLLRESPKAYSRNLIIYASEGTSVTSLEPS